ncbi:MAG: cytochrome c biogenesis protein CcsA, partial [Leptospiraceae bacterium]|nr:cytochrome c biogenesis protein CcsA [Leptospiraceae bacterium]
MARSFYREILTAWEFLSSRILRWSGLKSRAMALNLAARAIYANLALVSLGIFVLASLLIGGDLANRYVVHNSSPSLGLFYRITGVWAGSAGSLLFWYFLLCLFSAIAVYQTRNRLFNRLPALYWILATVQLLFICLAVFFKDAQPFRTYAVTMAAGQGINPLLLHWAMIIHPPILYTGYVSFAIPFAITASALLSGNMREDWLPVLRKWALFSWFFLGFGILLGSKWAYEELGWGGYWAWDPVENSSLMPFLLATAFLHSLIVQERRQMLRFWNVFLIITTYHFCLLGTWITRSGILQGPHTFAESTIGRPMIIFIAISYLYFLRFLYFQKHKLKPEHRLEAV